LNTTGIFKTSRFPDLHGNWVLVTGGAGFIGSHLVDALLERGARVRVLDNLTSGRRENVAHCLDRIEFVEGDICDLPTCQRACVGMDILFHEAAVGSVPRSLADPAGTIAVNVCGTANIFAAARDAKVGRVIYASSSSVYGDSELSPKREGEEGRLLSPYAVSKMMNEELAEVFARCYEMEFIGLRYFNVFGPRQSPSGPYAAVIPLFFEAYLAGEAPIIYGDGQQSRDFTFVTDAVNANLLAAAAPESASAGVYNVAGGRATTVEELAQKVREVVGGGPEPRKEAPRQGDIKHSLADLSLSREQLGYEPVWSLSRGLAACRPHYAASSSSNEFEVKR
jgi:nucleoside-diphosphate-sugar epimerase